MATTNRATINSGRALNMDEQVALHQNADFFVTMSRSALAGPHGRTISRFLRNF